MTAYTWNASSSGTWNTSTDWNPNGVPGSGDTATFDGTSTQNCRLDVAINVAGITVTSAYTGTIDAATDNLNHTIGTSGLSAGNTSIRLNMGSGTWTTNGKFDIRNTTNLNAGTSTLILASTSANSVPPWGSSTILNNVTVAASADYYMPGTNDFKLDGDMIVNGTYTMDSGRDVIFDSSATLTVGSSGHLENGNVKVSDGSNLSIVNNGQISCVLTDMRGTTANTTLSGSGQFTGNLRINLNNGNECNINSDIEVSDLTLYSASGTNTVNANSANIIINGDVDFSNAGAGVINWSVGTGTITLSGDVAQDIDFDGETVEDIEIDTTNTVTLTGGVVTDSLTLTQGTLDVNAQALETTGNFTMAAGTTVTE